MGADVAAWFGEAGQVSLQSGTIGLGGTGGFHGKLPAISQLSPIDRVGMRLLPAEGQEETGGSTRKLRPRCGKTAEKPL